MASKRRYLIAPQQDIVGSKLPSKEEVLALTIYRIDVLNKTIKEAASLVTDAVLEVWAKARIPAQRRDNIVAKIMKLHKEFSLVKKNKRRKGAAKSEREKSYQEQMKDLFDVARADALSTMSNEEDKSFLLAQREPCRRGKMGTVDIEHAALELRVAQRRHKEQRQRQRAEAQASTSRAVIQLESSSSSEASAAESESDGQSTPPKRSRSRRARTNIVTPTVAAALDRVKVSDRGAVFVLTETARTLGHDVTELNVNRSSIRRQRRQHRSDVNTSLTLKKEIEVGGLVVHWDGKLMQDITSKDLVDRLPILVSGSGTTQLLGVPKLASGTGANMANAVVEMLEKWGISDRISGLSFDTTASNTGRNNGACVLIEQRLEKDLLYLACRHHILELVLAAVYAAAMGTTSGPNVSLFKRFQGRWKFLDKAEYKSGLEHPDVAPLIATVETGWLEAAVVERKGLRDDYQELLELTMLFVGVVPRRGVRFCSPGPVHHARWMAKAIYALKVWMFREQFQLTVKEESSLRNICIFIARFYAKAWTQAPIAAAAPRNDLEFLKGLATYAEDNPALGKVALHKMQSHLWYLSEELVALALFDQAIPPEEKSIVDSVRSRQSEENSPAKRPTLPTSAIGGLELRDLASTNTRRFFEKLGLEDGFLDAEPETWNERDDFRMATAAVAGIAVVNDHAERGVALIQEYNRRLTHDEEQLQFLMQVVSRHRSEFPDSRKRTLATPGGNRAT